MKNKAVDFNHISKDLSDDDRRQLIALYKTYHKLMVCHTWLYKRLKRQYIAIQMTSITLSVCGAIIGSISLNPIVIAVCWGSVLIQGYISKSELRDRVKMSKFASDTYQKICNEIRSYLRGLSYDEIALLSDIRILDDIVNEQCQTIYDSLLKKYDKIFI